MIFCWYLSVLGRGYFVYTALDAADCDHEHGVTDEDEVEEDVCACPLDGGKVAEGGVGGVTGPACNVDEDVVKREALDPICQQYYDFNLKF